MNSELFLSLALRSFAPPLFGLTVIVLWRKSSASTRRVVWLVSFVALIVLPLALLKLPAVQVVENKLAAPAPTTVVYADSATKTLTHNATKTSHPSPTVAQTEPTQPSSSKATTTPAAYTGPSLLQIGLLIWCVGATTVLAPWVFGLFRLSRLRMQPVSDPDLHTDLATACHRLGIRRIPVLAMCAQTVVPMVFGHFRPRLVLPIEASDWSDETRQAIFLHECAHIRRKDWLGLLFSRIVTAAYWFNPLVWLAARQFRAECEAAADDTVLLNGIAPSLYAGELLRIAMEVRPRTMAGSVAILEIGSLKPRIARLLEKNRSRGSVSPVGIGISLALSCVLASFLGITYRSVAGPLVSNDGFADLGEGRHLRIVAIIQRTAKSTKAWNMRGELLPNSMPLPDDVDGWLEASQPKPPQAGLRYVVFAQNYHGYGVESVDHIDASLSSSPPAPFTSVMSQTKGMGYSVSRIDGDTMSVASLLSNGAPFGSIHCVVPGAEIHKIDEMRPGGSAAYSRQTPIRWTMSDEEHSEWKNAVGGVFFTSGRPVNVASPPTKVKSTHFAKFEVDVPTSWNGEEIILEVRSASKMDRFTLKGEPGRQSCVTSLDPKLITIATLGIRSRTDLVYDHIPLNPTQKIADSADLDISKLKSISSSQSSGDLIGIADPLHPEWGAWRPDGSRMAPIVGLSLPYIRTENLPLGNIHRSVELIFRAAEGNNDRVAATDVSGVLLASGITMIYTPSGKYDIESVFLDPALKSMRLISKVPNPDRVTRRIKLTHVPRAKLDKAALTFLSSRIGTSAGYYLFEPKLISPLNGLERSLEFYYGNKVAPIGSWQSYSTDWEDGVLALDAKRPERINGANVLEHDYTYYSYPKVALFPRGHK